MGVEDFTEFKKHFKYYQNLFGLNGYHVYFVYSRLNKSYANISVDQNSMVATVRLNSKLLKREELDKDIKRSAKHEALHLLLAKYSHIAGARYVTSEEPDEAEEELVNKLSNIIQ